MKSQTQLNIAGILLFLAGSFIIMGIITGEAFYPTAIALIIFLIVRNQKDEKDFEQHLNDDYRKTNDEEDDAATEEGLK